MTEQNILLEAAQKRIAELEAQVAALQTSTNDDIVQSLFQNNPFPMWMYDKQSLSFLLVNDAACKRYGYTPAEFYTMTLRDIRPTEDVPALLEAIDAIAEPFHESGPWRHKTRDGRIFSVMITTHDTFYRGRPARLVIAHDITDRLEAERGQKAAEQRFQRLVEGSPDIVYIFSARRGGIYYSPRVTDVLGYSLEYLYAHPFLWNTSIHPDDSSRVAQVIQEFEHNQSFSIEYRIRTASGEWRWLHDRSIDRLIQGGDTLIEGLAMDITEQKRAQQELRASEQQYRTLVESADDAILLTDIAGRHIFVNTAYYTSLGYAVGEDPNLDGFSSVHPDDIPEIKEKMKSLLQTGVYSGEYRVFHRDGRLLNRFTKSTLIRDEAGNPQAILSIIRDITDRKQAEQEIQRLNAELEQRVRQRTAQLESANQELEAFSYSVSHDLRAPLRAINGFTTILEKDYLALLPDDARPIFDHIRSASQRMSDMIEALLKLSRSSRQPLNLQVIDPGDLVRQALEMLAAEREGRQIAITIGPLPACRGDENLLLEVWINLLSNAIKFTGQTPSAKIEIGSQVLENQTVYFVKDNGVGFDMQYADKLFNAFQRLHSTADFAGAGIGLALVARIVRRHGGRIWTEAVPKQGAVFYFTLE